MKKLFLIILTFLSLSAFSQENQFEVLEPITFSGLNAQTIADTIRFEAGAVVAFKESFGVLVFEKDGITVRTDYKSLKKLQDEGKLSLPTKMIAEAEPLTREEAKLKKINNKLNFLTWTTILGVLTGIIALLRSLWSE
ncbi:MAG: hypothetical protein AAFN10_09965 [Bacteroidota bacterium]